MKGSCRALARLRGCNAAFRTAANPGELRRSAAAANPVLCAEHIAFPLGKVARCGAARTVTDEGRPPAAGVLGAAVISEGSSVGLYPAAHRAAYFPLCYAIFFVLSNGTRSDTIRIRAVDGGKVLTAYSGVNGRRDGKTAKSVGNVYFADSDLGDARQEWIPVAVKKYYWPTECKRLNTSYPYNPSKGHLGVDIQPLQKGVAGDNVYAYMDGYVSFIRNSIANNPDEGYTVRIHHNNPLKDDNGYARIRTQYMHLNSAPLVSVGNRVTAGQLIGYMGTTGNSTGVHLHFEVRGGSESDFAFGGSSGYNTGTVLDPADYLALT